MQDLFIKVHKSLTLTFAHYYCMYVLNTPGLLLCTKLLICTHSNIVSLIYILITGTNCHNCNTKKNRGIATTSSVYQ